MEAYALAFSGWLQRWQDLAGALVGAAFLTGTVGWTLLAERRRRESEAAAFRVALGAEIRQLCASALNSYERLAGFAKASNPVTGNASLTASQLAYQCRYPEPVVYPRGADKLGILGETPAFEAVYFYAQLSLLRESVNGVDAARDPTRHVSMREVLIVMAAMLSAARAAVKAVPAFQGDSWSEQDGALTTKYEAAVEVFKRLQSTGGKAVAPGAVAAADKMKGPPHEQAAQS